MDSLSRPSADLAGRTVRISPDVPAMFDVPLAAHHKLIGRWVEAIAPSDRPCTRHEARARIERTFNDAVLDILQPFDMAELRAVVLQGDDSLPPALVLICDSLGSLDLGWIEKSNVLRQTLFTNVAPLGWRAAAYKELVGTLNIALPVFHFDDLLAELSMYYWEGEETDEGARHALTEWFGQDPEEIDEDMLPSAIRARRPDWMLAENAAPLKDMPTALANKIRALRKAYAALEAQGDDRGAWRFDLELIREYVDDYEDRSGLPPVTLVPFDQFQRELDDVGRFGMETGFMDVCGICQLDDADKVGAWLASLKLGVAFLLAAQDLIDFDPAGL